MRHMGRTDPDHVRGHAEGGATSARYTDADGRVTTDPAAAVHGEIVRYDAHGQLRRTRFFLTERELPWLPVSEPAFLIWVLASLMVVWLAVAVALRLT